MLHLLEHLAVRADGGRPIRVMVIGAGKFGSMFLSQARRIRGLHVVAVVDLSPDRARAALRETAEESGLSLPPEAVGGIDFICRAITPTRSHRRYNTRFLLADGTACRGALAGDGELEDLGWHRHSAVGRLKLVDVTDFVLEEAVRRWRLALRPGAEPAVRYSYAGGRVRIFRRPLP